MRGKKLQFLAKKISKFTKTHKWYINKVNNRTTTRIQNPELYTSHINTLKEKNNVLSLGTAYAIVIKPKRYINEIIIEAENAIKQIEHKWQKTCR